MKIKKKSNNKIFYGTSKLKRKTVYTITVYAEDDGKRIILISLILKQGDIFACKNILYIYII